MRSTRFAHDAQVMPDDVQVELAGRGHDRTSRAIASTASVIFCVRLGAVTGAGGVDHAVREVLLEQADRDGLEGLRHRRDLGEDVDAVLLVLDHPLQPAGLALDAAQPLEVVVLAVDVAVLVLCHTPSIPPRGTNYLGGLLGMPQGLGRWPHQGGGSGQDDCGRLSGQSPVSLARFSPTMPPTDAPANRPTRGAYRAAHHGAQRPPSPPPTAWPAIGQTRPLPPS